MTLASLGPIQTGNGNHVILHMFLCLDFQTLYQAELDCVAEDMGRICWKPVIGLRCGVRLTSFAESPLPATPDGDFNALELTAPT